MPKLPLDPESLVVSTFETVSIPVADQPGEAQVVDRTVFLCRPSQNWTCTG